MMFALIYLQAKDKLIEIKDSLKFKTLWHFSWSAGYIISMLGFPFIESNIEPTIWTAIYGGLMKHYHSLLIGVVVLGIIVRSFDFIKILNLPIFRVLGRISYSYYLSHIFLMRLFMPSGTQPLEISMTNAWIYTAAIFFFGNLLSIPLALIVEFPINTIAKEILKKFDGEEKSSDLNENGLYLKSLES